MPMAVLSGSELLPAPQICGAFPARHPDTRTLILVPMPPLSWVEEHSGGEAPECGTAGGITSVLPLLVFSDQVCLLERAGCEAKVFPSSSFIHSKCQANRGQL